MDHHWDTAPVLYDVIGHDGRVEVCNRTQSELLGYGERDLVGASIDQIYTTRSADTLRNLVAQCETKGATHDVVLQMRRRDGSLLDVTANTDSVSAPGEQAGLCTVKTRLDGVFEKLRQLERDNEVLRGFVQPARDACWCIEFFEPVDLTAPQDEVIRQMFENQCSWRLCNDAMGRLYEYPSGVEFNEQDVREVFRRNAENEDFVRILIEAQFNIDGAPSLDYLYDGTEIHAENDVRGQIENGHLLRMWGNVRDLSGQKRKEKELSERLDAMRDILSAAPDPILVLREDGVLEAANPAFEWCFGWSVDSQLGRDISAIVQGGKSVAAIIGDMRIVTPAAQTALQVTCANGSVKTCDARIASLGDEGGDMRAVMTLRDRTDQVNGGAHDAV